MQKSKSNKSSRRHLLISASIASVFLGIGPATFASEAVSASEQEFVTNEKPGVISYAPEFFAKYHPTNAAQMVGQVPGFSIINGAEIRGLAGAEGNVLVDGSRPALKGQDLHSYLSTIPVSSVKRIEILEGAGLGNLGAGHSILVNVIRNEVAKPSGTLEASLNSWGDIVRPRFEASYNWQAKGFKFSTNFETGPFQLERRVGFEYLKNATGDLIEIGSNNELQDYSGNSLSLNAEGKINSVKANLSLSYDNVKFNRDWNYLPRLPNGLNPIREDKGSDQSIDETYGVGAAFEKKIGEFDAKLEFSSRYQKNDGSYIFGVLRPAQTPEFSKFVPNFESFEAVTQTSFSRKFSNHNISFGGETGFNKLDSKSGFYIGDGNNFSFVSGSNSNTIVSEIRSEAFISDNMTISPKLSLVGKLRAEWSRINQEGDKERERSFVYLKPRIALTYKVSDSLNLKAGFERKLGQLDFNDFAFQASLTEGTNTEANDHLQPNKNDEFNLEIEKKWGKNGNFTISFTNDQIHNAIALVPVTENGVIVGETVGNVDDAKKSTMSISSKVPLDKYVKGLEFNISYRYAKSEILDPFTNQTREYFSGGDTNFESSFIWNIEEKKQEYGIFFFRGERNSDYRFDSQYLWPNLNYWGMWANMKDLHGFEVEFEVEVPNGFSVKRHRTQYEISRFDGLIASTQYKQRDIGPRLQISVKKLI